ncbi:MAG: hypothetical protein ACRD3P_09335 [Terriglobales bacterium]
MHTPARRENRSSAVDGETRAGVRPAGWSGISEAILLSAAVAMAVFLLQWRYGFLWSDEGWLWYISQRTALGQVPLRDIFSYDPGRYYWSAALFRLTGRSGLYQQILADYLFAILGITATYFAMIRAGLARSWRVAILPLLGVVIGFPRHKIYEQTLSLICVGAIAFVFESPQRLKRWFMLGVAIGLAAFFGRNSGIFFGIATITAFVLLSLRREGPSVARATRTVAVGVLVGYSPLLIMLVAVPGFAAAFFHSLLLTPKWAWSLKIPFPWHVHLKGLRGMDLVQARAISWLCLAVPFTYAASLWRVLRRNASVESTEWLAAAASAAGAGFLVHAFYTADFFHIAEGVVPFVIAAGALSAHLWRDSRRWSLTLFWGMAFLVIASWLPMEPLVQHLRHQADDPASEQQININGKRFEVPAEQAEIMNAVAAAFRDCGQHDGGFLAAPFYPGLYAFLHTRAPTWDTYFLWPRSDQLQQAEIEALQRNRTSLILLNPQFALNGRERLELVKTNPKLVEYSKSAYQRSALRLPDGFELYYSPQCCGF